MFAPARRRFACNAAFGDLHLRLPTLNRADFCRRGDWRLLERFPRRCAHICNPTHTTNAERCHLLCLVLIVGPSRAIISRRCKKESATNILLSVQDKGLGLQKTGTMLFFFGARKAPPGSLRFRHPAQTPRLLTDKQLLPIRNFHLDWDGDRRRGGAAPVQQEQAAAPAAHGRRDRVGVPPLLPPPCFALTWYGILSLRAQPPLLLSGRCRPCRRCCI